jgi:hypothetical protein
MQGRAALLAATVVVIAVGLLVSWLQARSVLRASFAVPMSTADWYLLVMTFGWIPASVSVSLLSRRVAGWLLLLGTGVSGIVFAVSLSIQVLDALRRSERDISLEVIWAVAGFLARVTLPMLVLGVAMLWIARRERVLGGAR